MLTRFKVTKTKQQPKKRNLFITRHFHPKMSLSKKLIKKHKKEEKEKQNNEIIKIVQTQQEPKIEIEKIEEKFEIKEEKIDNKENLEPKIIIKTNKIIPPKVPCNLFCILHDQVHPVNHPPKKPEPLLKKKRIIDEETGNSIGRWGREEHKKFIEAIIKYGNNWKEVQEYIDTRTSTQARSHAQKFFEKLRKNKTLKYFKQISIDSTENFTNSTINQLHKIYGNKSRSEINNIVNKFLSLEYDNPKKRRRNMHPYIGNKKNISPRKINLELEEEVDENNENEENNKNINYENNNMNKSNINPINNNNNEYFYGNDNNQKYDEEYNSKLWENQFRRNIYKGDGIDYILNELINNVTMNCFDNDIVDRKNKKRRKDTFGINEEEESYFVEDNLAYNGVMNNNNIINYNNNIINYNNNINNLNIQNLNMKSKSRKNSVESIRKFHGFEEGRLSVDMNDVLFQNIFEDEKGIKI